MLLFFGAYGKRSGQALLRCHNELPDKMEIISQSHNRVRDSTCTQNENYSQHNKLKINNC
jgi:hypothetical protein